MAEARKKLAEEEEAARKVIEMRERVAKERIESSESGGTEGAER